MCTTWSDFFVKVTINVWHHVGKYFCAQALYLCHSVSREELISKRGHFTLYFVLSKKLYRQCWNLNQDCHPSKSIMLLSISFICIRNEQVKMLNEKKSYPCDYRNLKNKMSSLSGHKKSAVIVHSCRILTIYNSLCLSTSSGSFQDFLWC